MYCHLCEILNSKVFYSSVQTNITEETTNLLKQLYDTTKSVEKKTDDDALPELIVKDFDEEQIWQELELQNSARFKLLANTIQKFTKNDLVYIKNTTGKSFELRFDMIHFSRCSNRNYFFFLLYHKSSHHSCWSCLKWECYKVKMNCIFNFLMHIIFNRFRQTQDCVVKCNA